MMFKSIFVKQIFNSQEASDDVEFAVLNREEQLPFAPCPGHEFFWGCGKTQKIVTAIWHIEDSYFSCGLEDEFPDEIHIDGCDFNELVSTAQEDGWSLVKIYPAK